MREKFKDFLDKQKPVVLISAGVHLQKFYQES